MTEKKVEYAHLKRVFDKLPERAQNLVEAMRPHVAKGENTIPGNVFTDNLPEGQTPEMVAELTTYRKDFGTALAYVAGEAGLNRMVADKDVATITITAAEGVDSPDEFSVHMMRESTKVDPKTQEPLKIHGSMRFAHNEDWARKIGGIGQVTQAVRLAATDAFTS